MKNSKIANVLRGTIAGVSNSVILVILNLLSRNLFLEYIGIDYLSVAQVINNLLTVIAFSELGLFNAVIYMLYKPVSANNKEKIILILYLYRKFNQYVGISIAIIGLLAIPTLHLFIRTDIPLSTVILIYLMNLFTVVLSYFYTYRAVLLSANQCDYVVSIIYTIFSFIRIIIQCFIVYLTHDYIVFLIVGLAATILQNSAVFYKAGKMYPYICDISKQKIVFQNRTELLNERKILKRNIMSMAFVKITGIAINNTDIIIASWINTIMVGLCSNYMLISNYLKSIIGVFQNVLMHSIGISLTEKNISDRYALFQQINLINTFIAGIVFVCLSVLWNDFIIIWIGEKYVIDEILFISILMKVVWTLITSSIWMFRDSLGLFNKVKYMLLLNTVMNILFSILLGYFVGIPGVFFATIIADIMTNFWYDSNLVYRTTFKKKNALKYQMHIFENIISTAILSYFLILCMSDWNITIFNWLFKLFICILIYTLFFFVRFRKKRAFQMLLQKYLYPIFRKILKRRDCF